MPRKLMDVEGNEFEVLTEDEQKELEAKAKQAEVIPALRQELGIKEDADIVEAVKVNAKSANPNWKAIRTANENMKKFIESQTEGNKVNEDGTVVSEKNKQMTGEDVDMRIKQGILQERIKDRLAKYPQEQREAVEAAFKKFSNGEDLVANPDKVEESFKFAETYVFPQGTRTIPNIAGAAPRDPSDENKQDYGDTQEGKSLADAMGLPIEIDNK